jgi:PEGA domain-containing protein
MRLVYRSLMYSIAVLLSMYAVCSSAAEKYKLTVQVTPADSTIKFDTSTLEYRADIELAPGRYALVITRDGHKPARRQVTISTADVVLQVMLAPEKLYTLTVRAEPADSSIKLVNSREAYQPGMELTMGRYEVLVTHDGYKPARRWVTIYDADVSLDITLEPEK